MCITNSMLVWWTLDSVPLPPVAYTENFHGGAFIQWQMVVICIWCVLFVTSQFDVIFMFSSEVC